MKKLLFLLLFLLPLSYTYSQEKKWEMFAFVINSFTRKPIQEEIKVELMLPDSTVVDTATNHSLKFQLDGSQNNYILRLSHPDYATVYKPVTIKYYKKERWIEIGEIPMRKLSKTEREIMLDEVVIKTTKVKFFNKGDTLIYNADAFQLAEGSMLDELITQLPGAELKDDGRIYINGKFVESLLLNGRDFFKGDNTIMLDNLPAYMVKDLKVYNEESEMSKLLGRKVDEGRYVMDVQLKRQYSIGWIANTEWGAGTEDRYLGRLFGMRFTPQSRITFFGNMNNINDNRKPGRNGDWTPSDLSGGLMASKTSGLDYGVYDKFNHCRVEGNTQITYTDNDVSREVSTTNFLPSGDTYNYDQYDSRNKNTRFTTSHFLELRDSKSNSMSISPSITYNNYRNNFLRRGGAFTENIFNDSQLLDSILTMSVDIDRILINRLKQERLGKGHDLRAGIGYFMYLKIPHTNDGMNITANASYADAKNETFDKYRLEYPSVQPDVRNRYFDTPYNSYTYNVETNYFYHPAIHSRGSWMINPKYRFEHKYNSTTNHLYRLDQIEGWNPENDFPLGTLPSAREDMMQLLDITNSYESREHTTLHMAELRMIWYGSKTKDGKDYAKQQIGIYPTVFYEEKHFDYVGSERQRLEKTTWLFCPRFELKLNTAGLKHELIFNYRMNMSSPYMMNLLDLTFDSDPLNIRKGNPGLKNTTSHQLSFDYRADKWLHGTGKMLNASVGYSTRHNAAAMGYIYDKTTGIRTTTPENINGNWRMWFNNNYTTPVDKERKVTLSNNIQLDYSDNADLIGINEAAIATKSIVHNLFLRENLSADYRLGKHRIGTKVRLGWTNATSGREDFERINAINLDYSLTGQVVLPLDMQLSSDVTLYTRHGYSDENMNTNEFVWNARLSKSTLNGNLVFTLDGFDILGNLKKVNYSLNGQGRTETRINSIPRYVMLRAIYKLNKQPKKKS